MMVSLVLALLSLSPVSAYSQTFWPYQLPLAVRSPYFSTWQLAPSNTPLLQNFPTFWLNDENASLQGLIRVDGETYRWLGGSFNIPPSANLTNFQVTPTHTIFTFVAGPIDFNITYLTPIEPSDWVRQSMPFTYVTLEASSNDGQAHTVEAYCDMNAEWVSGNRSAVAVWSTTTTGQVVYHQIELQNPAPFTEYNQMAEDGKAYIAMLYESADSSTITYMTGSQQTLRYQFNDTGALSDSADSNFRGIWDDFPAFAISQSLGSITNTSSPVVWALGYVRSPSIKYTAPSGETQLRYPYYVTQYSTIDEVIYAFLADYDDAFARSTSLDAQLHANASSISSNYSDLISISARQGFGGIDITVSNGTDNNWNVSDTMIFMKDIGNISYNYSRVNPVEVMYAAMPMFLYFNASYLGALLYPVLEYATSPNYTYQYAPRDIGAAYPVAGGDNPSAFDQGVEQSGNILIMALAHARISGDGSLISRYYDQFKQWADYLQDNAKTPQDQETADYQNAANMTNLALKGIVALQAMAEISKALDESSDATLYQNAASTYYGLWESLGVSAENNVLFSFGDAETWTLLYNLYADRLLGTDIVANSIIEGQTAYYQDLIEAHTGGPYGLPLNADLDANGNSAWLMFTAATTSNSSTRNALLDMVWARASLNSTPDAFPMEYDVSTGAETGGQASPGQGAMFALLALNLSSKSITMPSSTAIPGTVSPSISSSVSQPKSVAGLVAGVAIGGLVVLLVLTVLVWFHRRRSRRRETAREKNATDAPQLDPFPYSPVSTNPLPDNNIDSTQAARAPPPKLLSYMPQFFDPSLRNFPSASTEPPPSIGGSGNVSSGVIVSLQNEVENLRRAMQEIQEGRLDAPPSYFHDS